MIIALKLFNFTLQKFKYNYTYINTKTPLNNNLQYNKTLKKQKKLEQTQRQLNKKQYKEFSKQIRIKNLQNQDISKWRQPKEGDVDFNNQGKIHTRYNKYTAGIIPICFDSDNKTPYLLLGLRSKDQYWQCFQGKHEKEDINKEYTAIREFMEETNNIVGDIQTLQQYLQCQKSHFLLNNIRHNFTYMISFGKLNQQQRQYLQDKYQNTYKNDQYGLEFSQLQWITFKKIINAVELRSYSDGQLFDKNRKLQPVVSFQLNKYQRKHQIFNDILDGVDPFQKGQTAINQQIIQECKV